MKSSKKTSAAHSSDEHRIKSSGRIRLEVSSGTLETRDYLMKTSTKYIGTLALAATLIASLAGCVAQTPAAAPKPTHSSTAVATPKPTVPVVSADPVVAAQVASGLTVERYAAATSQVNSFRNINDADTFRAKVSAMTKTVGKPIVIIAFHPCPPKGDNPGAMEWGIAGALYGNTVGCGGGYSATRAGALGEVDRRAGNEGWTASDYVLVIVDWS